MTRRVVAVVGITMCMFVCLWTAGTVLAATEVDPAVQPAEQGQPVQPAEPPAAVATPRTTPQAAIDWYQKQLQRMEQQQRAVEMRKFMMQAGESQPEQFEQPAPPVQ